MPEGDTIHRLARGLRPLVGEALTRTDFRVPRLATIDLSGQRVVAVVARGKHLLIRTDGAMTVHSHLRLDGDWRLVRPGRGLPGPWHEIRAVLETDPWVAVGRRLPVLELWRTQSEPGRLGHLGPDVLGAAWDPQEALRRLLADPGRPVGEAVLDQRVMAGPGNVYRCEACFLLGLDPRTPVGRVAEPRAMVDLMKRLMEANRDRAARVTTGDTRPGRRLWVYGRAGEPCRRCATPVVRIAGGEEPGERMVYLCPSCQPLRE